MLHSGLVSITFRALAPGEIVSLVKKAGLEGIEWGGDIHVPHGDLQRAREVNKMTSEAGLRVASYGSYYRVGHEEPVPFEAVLETALALGAPMVRVWAGKRGSAEADAAYREQVAQDSRRIAEMAAQTRVSVAYEFHGNTLTDTSTSARALLEQVAHENLRTYWQPVVGASVEDCLAGMEMILPWLENVHVFHWGGTIAERLPLAQGEEAWGRYLGRIATTGKERWAMLEFVRGDSPQAFLEDAQALKTFLARATGK
jgi:sugar phosphate isomerase/epimerase